MTIASGHPRGAEDGESDRSGHHFVEPGIERFADGELTTHRAAYRSEILFSISIAASCPGLTC